MKYMNSKHKNQSKNESEGISNLRFLQGIHFSVMLIEQDKKKRYFGPRVLHWNKYMGAFDAF